MTDDRPLFDIEPSQVPMLNIDYAAIERRVLALGGCPVFYTSDTQTCRRCRAQWDAGDYDGKCARRTKPSLGVIRYCNARQRPQFRERFRYVIRWETEKKAKKAFYSPTTFKDRDAAYVAGMDRVEKLRKQRMFG